MLGFRLVVSLVLLASIIPQDSWADLRFKRLAEPGIVAIMRHAYAPGTGDPANFAVERCETQRNLNETGREQADLIGAAIRTAGISVDLIYSSQWCRCLETAKLLNLGKVEELAAINSFFRTPSLAGERTRQLREFLIDLPPDRTVVLVTHYVNIGALTGKWVSSGEVVLLKVEDSGSISVVDTIVVNSAL